MMVQSGLATPCVGNGGAGVESYRYRGSAVATNGKMGIRVGQERETAHGWSYEIVVHPVEAGADDQPTRAPVRACLVSLNWSDHDHWSGGVCPPSVVIERLMSLLIELRPDLDLPERFDAATVRRWIPDLDAQLRARLGQPSDERA